MKRINCIEDFVANQFEFLRWNKELSKHIRSEDLARGYNAAILSIIAVGYPVAYNNGTILLSGERIGIDESYMTSIAAYKGCNLTQLDNIIKGSAVFTFKTKAEEDLEKKILEERKAAEVSIEDCYKEGSVSENAISSENAGEIESLNADEHNEYEANKDDSSTTEIVEEEQIKIEEPELIIIEKEEETISKTPFGIPQEDDTCKETSDSKYLNTMWFNKHHVVCRYKDNKNGMGLNEFDIIVYPLEQPNVQAPQLPVQIMVCILSQYNDRAKVFFPQNELKSATVELDEYVFLITGKFSKGKFISKVSLDPKSEYAITEDDDEVINQNGKFFPKNFGKVVSIGEDTVEFFPLYLDNKEQSGETTCAYRHIAPNCEPEYGISKGQALIATTVNKNRELVSYWKGYGDDKKFYVSMC